MFVNLIVMDHKPIPQAVAEAAMVRGAAVDGGKFIASVPKNYDGINAIKDPKWVESDEIAEGAIYNKVPTFVGERYATTEVTGAASLSVGAALTAGANGKWAAGSGDWKYGGVYANPYGVDMWIIEKVK